MTQRLPQLLGSYVQYHSIEGSTPATIKHKKKELGLFIRFLSNQGHSMQPEQLTMFDALGHLEDMKARGLSPVSVQTRYRAIRAFLQWAADWEIIPANPMAKLKAPKSPKIRKPFPTGLDTATRMPHWVSEAVWP